MPVPPRKPPAPSARPYNSQVAPNQKPFHATDRQTATTHQKIPTDQATQGRRYFVRDKDFGNGAPVPIWGKDLSYEDAVKLKEQVVTSRRSTTARVVDMEDEPHRFLEPEAGQLEEPPNLEPPPYEVPAPKPTTPKPTTPKPKLAAVPPADGRPAPGKAPFVKAAIKPDLSLEHQRGRARHAAAVAAHEANLRHQALKAKNGGPALAPLPKAPPSPLSDEIVDDIDPGDLDSAAIEGDELQELLSEVGGAPTADDVAKSKEQRDHEAQNRAQDPEAADADA